MKTLGDLFNGLNADTPPGVGDVAIEDICEDSRCVRPGTLFVARPGDQFDGRKFIPEALQAGASAILTTEFARDASIPVVLARDVPRTAAVVAERFFGGPSLSMPVVGITGTNGKTTVAYLTRQILCSFGIPAGLIGTVCVDTGRSRAAASLTTPQAIDTSRALADMRDSGRSAAVMEVSSHALSLGRVDAIQYAVGVFTNLSGDHLDYHGDMERYAEAKRRLFEHLPAEGTAIVNIDDAWSQFVTSPTTKHNRLTCSALDRGADVVVEVDSSSQTGMVMRLHGPWGTIAVETPIVGEFNTMNIAQATTAAWVVSERLQQSPKPSVMAEALTQVAPPPGRLEPVRLLNGENPPFSVLVDYAHSDDSLARACHACKSLCGHGGRVILVFGCGGDRDASKRPRMGRVAAQGADLVFITSDNPRSENPESIIDCIVGGIASADVARCHIAIDRADAIAQAIQEASDGDVVLIAGKGHEDYQLLPDGGGGVRRIDFDDRLVARRALTRRFGGGRSGRRDA